MFKTTLLVTLLLLLSGSLGAENLLINPESAAFDALNNRYLISDYGVGGIIQIETDLVTQSYYKTGLGDYALGNVIADNVFYTSVDGRYIKGFDLTTDEQVMDLTITGVANLDGMTADNSGNLYVMETGQGRIIKIEIASETQSSFASGLGSSPQDMFFDATNNRLLVCKYTSSPSPIYAVDVASGTVSIVLVTASGLYDGITMDGDGNTYLASHVGGGRIYKYDAAFTTPPELISNNHHEPAGPDFNIAANILAVPNFMGARVDFLSFNDIDDDGIIDYKDNCPNASNAGQEDSDGDSNGDVCDLCPGSDDNFDADGDTVPDDCDACVGFDDLADIDDDEIADGCDNCPNDLNGGQSDVDTDGVGDVCDNCPEHNNPGQEDSNGNGVGDLCDYVCGDADGDNLLNILDVVFLINNLYKSGSDPDPLEAADANHDFLLNILDVVYIINSIYKDGPNPECVVW